MGCAGNNKLILEKANSRGVFYDKNMTQFMEKSRDSTCKIINGGEYGSGFFCRIPYKEDEDSYINVLLTCEHVLKKDIVFSKDRDIKVVINDIEKIITLKKTRKKWSNEALDYSCIEIKETDNLDNDYYQLDDLILKKDYDNKLFLKKNFNKIIIFAIMKGEERGYDSGNITKIVDNNFIHNCNTYQGCSGGVIVNKIKNSVIGMHRGNINNSRNEEIQNVGIFIKDIIDDIKKYPVSETKGDEIEDKREMNIIDEINIKYEYKEKFGNFWFPQSYIRLFGKKFVENNKDICKIIINGKENELVEFYSLKNKKLENNIIEGNLKPEIRKTKVVKVKVKKSKLKNKKLKRNIKNIKNIKNKKLNKFKGKVKNKKFKELKNVEVEIKLKGISNITKMNNLFDGCKHLSSVSDISNWNTKKVIDMSNLFCECISLKSLPDLSHWKTRNVTDMSKLFCQCKLLSELPDISYWNTENVTNMEKLFYGCHLLKQLPDISK